MITIKHTTSFVLHQKEEGGPHYLECRWKWDSSRCVVALSTGFAVDPEKWDARSMRCLPRTAHGRKKIPAAVINREVERFITAGEEVFTALGDAEIWPTPAELRRRLRLQLGIDNVIPTGFSEAFASYMRGGTLRSWSEGTVKKYSTLRDHILAWRPDIRPDDFNKKAFDSFALYLLNDLGMRNASIVKYAGLLKAFLRWCDDRHYLTCRDYATWKLYLKDAPPQVVFLNWGELMQVWNWNPTLPFYGRVRDIFCFCAFTSLRYGDAMALRWSDVTDTSLRIVSHKDVDGLVIELNKWSQTILGRYLDEGYPDDRVLPKISNQVCNRALKEVMRLAGITAETHIVYYKGGKRVDEYRPKCELVGTHTGRRTFISNALMMGIPATTVMKWTGHTDYTAMKPYIAVADSDKAAQMSKFDKK